MQCVHFNQLTEHENMIVWNQDLSYGHIIVTMKSEYM